jgi:chromosome partitioning protein
VFIIAVTNQKGGVGKTTTVANLGQAVAQAGCEVCLLDLDPQSHLTLHFGIEPGSTPSSIYDVLTDDADLASTCVEIAERLLLVPSEIDLAAAEVELAATVAREQILRDALREAALRSQLVLIDCPPSLGLLTLNALVAADELFIPLQPHFLALQGLGKLLETVRLVKRRVNPVLRVAGVVLCMYETGTRLAAEVVADLRAFFEAARGTDCPWDRTRIFSSVIRRNIKLAECPSHGRTIFQYAPSSRGAADYSALAAEFVQCYPDLFPAPPRPEPPAGYNPAQAPPIVPISPPAPLVLYDPAQAPLVVPILPQGRAQP